jgi:hypothetical protein
LSETPYPNPHFVQAASWEEARTHVDFSPRIPSFTNGKQLASLAIFVRDHKMREVSRSERSLEAHYGSFAVAQSMHGAAESRRLTLEVKYGLIPVEVTVAGREGRAYDRRPPAEPDGPEGGAPAVVVWFDEAMFYLVASDELELPAVMRIAESLYAGD